MFASTLAPNLDSFVGGAERTYRICHIVNNVALDLTGYTYRVEIQWDGCTRICLTEGDGITRLTDAPAIPLEDGTDTDANFHYSFTLDETTTRCIPVGKSPVKLFYISPADVTEIDLVYITRTL